MPKNKMSNKKTPKLHITQKQNTQDNKKPKFTKCPKLQNVQSYKMSEITKYPKLQFLLILFLCSFELKAAALGPRTCPSHSAWLINCLNLS